MAVVGIIAVSVSACSGTGKKEADVGGCTGTISTHSLDSSTTSNTTSLMSPEVSASVNSQGEPSLVVTNLAAGPRLVVKAQGALSEGSEHASQNVTARHAGQNAEAWTEARDTRAFNGAAPESIPVMRPTKDSRAWTLTLNEDGTADWVVDWYFERPGGKKHYEDKGFAVDAAKRAAVCKVIASLPDNGDELVTDSGKYNWDFNFGKGETWQVTETSGRVERAIAELIGKDRWKAE